MERILSPAKLSDLTSSSISEFQSSLRSAGLAESTIKGHLAYLKAALRWANRQQIVLEVPVFDMPKAPGMKGRPISTEEFERMLQKVSEVVGGAAADSWCHLLNGLWWSGLRLGEAMSLSWDIGQPVSVDSSGRRPMFHLRADAHKSRKDCVLPMAPEFWQFLDGTPTFDRCGFVFNPQSRRDPSHRLRLDSVSKVICRIGKAAGVKVADRSGTSRNPVKFASAHDLRRTFGYRWSMRVMPVVLQQLMRHESISTTMEFYVGKNALAAADALWDAAGNISGNSGVPALTPSAHKKHASGRDDTTCVRAAGETRTPDLGITNASLYQLSYSG